jgi:hypothetical protein
MLVARTLCRRLWQVPAVLSRAHTNPYTLSHTRNPTFAMPRSIRLGLAGLTGALQACIGSWDFGARGAARWHATNTVTPKNRCRVLLLDMRPLRIDQSVHIWDLFQMPMVSRRASSRISKDSVVAVSRSQQAARDGDASEELPAVLPLIPARNSKHLEGRRKKPTSKVPIPASCQAMPPYLLLFPTSDCDMSQARRRTR